MIFTELEINGTYVTELEPIKDERGFFLRNFCLKEFSRIHKNLKIAQVNTSFTKRKGTIRGLHFQLSPHSEIKIVRCTRGSVFDVFVDLRKDSPTFLKWHGEVLSADNMKLLFIPKGFAHGFQSLEDNCEMIYFHDELHNKNLEMGLRFSDPKIGVDWPLPKMCVSERDKNHSLIEFSFAGIDL